MPAFGETSRRRLSTCHPDLIRIAEAVVVDVDCSVLCGIRTREAQEAAFQEGRSKVRYPDSKHNRAPSEAIDLAPYPVDWDDRGRFYMFVGWVMKTANDLFQAGEISHKLRSGADWDGDGRTDDQTFDDLVHFELVEAE